jgi:hypothetical protein
MGGLYIRSQEVSRLVASELGTNIHNAPSGMAFLRWGVRPAGLHRLDILISGVGRFGNSIIQVLNALHIARCLDSQTVFFHRFDAVSNKDMALDAEISARKLSLSWQPRSRTPRIIWRTYGMALGALLSDPCAADFESARAALAGSLTVELKPPKNSPEENTLTIYLRSGDIYSPNPHVAYGQPPWAFYNAVLAHKPWGAVRLVCEDDVSPVHNLILDWCGSRGLRVIRTGASLADAIDEISQSRFLVSARGTFVPAILYLSKAPRDIYLFHDPPSQLLCADSTNIFTVMDHRGLYVDSLMSTNWTNSDDQRNLMVSYPRSNLSEITRYSQTD